MTGGEQPHLTSTTAVHLKHSVHIDTFCILRSSFLPTGMSVQTAPLEHYAEEEDLAMEHQEELWIYGVKLRNKQRKPLGSSSVYYPVFDRLDIKVDSLKRHVIKELLRKLVDAEGTLTIQEMGASIETRARIFLQSHGHRFWGPDQRDHLNDANPNTGLLYPRDAMLDDSR